MFRDRTVLIAEIPHLRRFAYALARDRERADDLVQSCLERAVSKFGQWDSSRPLRPWLFAILHNLYVDTVRSRSGDPGAEVPLSEAITVSANEASQDQTLNAKQVLEAIDRLPAMYRDPLILVGLNELSYAQAAAVLEISAGTLMSRLHRAREKLRETLSLADRHPMIRRIK